jgi:predicted nucleotidyltransferase
MNKQLESIQSKALPILKQFGVTQAGIFGSRATNSGSDNSDVDLLIDAPDSLSMFDLLKLKHSLEDSLGIQVDLVEYKLLKPFIKKRALQEEIRIL